IKPQYVMEQISKITDGEAFMVTGVGQHQMWAAQYYKFKHPRAWFTSGGLGTMGYGLPTAMGVQAAHPGRLVINVDGDGSFQMNSQEMATCFTEHLPVKTVIINNSGHGMVRQWQRIIYKERYCAIDLPGIPDWVRLAEAYGCMGLRVTKPRDVGPAIEQMIATPGPGGLDMCGDKDEGGFPVVPGGGARPQQRHDPDAADPRGEGEGREVPDGILGAHRDGGRGAAEAHHRGDGGEQVRRAVAGGRAVLGARVQHRESLGGGDPRSHR